MKDWQDSKYFTTKGKETSNTVKNKVLTASVLAGIFAMGGIFAPNEVCYGADVTWRSSISSGKYSGSWTDIDGNLKCQGGNNFTVKGVVTGNISVDRYYKWGWESNLMLAPNGCQGTITLCNSDSRDSVKVVFNRATVGGSNAVGLANQGILTCNITTSGTANYTSAYFQVNTIIPDGATVFDNTGALIPKKTIKVHNLYLQSTMKADASSFLRKSGNISNTGTLTLIGGEFTSNLTGAGTLIIDTGKSVTMSYRVDNKIQLKDDATLTINASNINHEEGIFASGTGSKVILNGGTLAKQIAGSAALDITGTVTAPLSLFNTPETMGDWTVTSAGNFILTDGTLTKTIVNSGTVTLKGATLGNATAVTSGTLAVAADTTFSANYLLGDTNRIDSGAVLTLTDGTISKGIVDSKGQLVIGGNVDINNKTILISHNALPAAQEANYYDITVADGATFTVNSTNATSGEITGKILNNSEGTISVEKADVLSGTSNIHNLGNLYIKEGNLTRSITGDDAGVLQFGTGTANKTVTVQNNVVHDFEVMNKTTLKIGAGMIQGDVTLNSTNTTMIINASGTMDKTIKGEGGTITVDSDMKLGKNAHLENTDTTITINKKVSMVERDYDSSVQSAQIYSLTMTENGYLDIADYAAEHLNIYNFIGGSSNAKLYLDMVEDYDDYSVKMDTISAENISGTHITIDGINVAYELLDHDDSKPLFSNTIKAAGLAKFDLDVLEHLDLDETGDSGSALMVYGGYIFEFKRAKVTPEGKVISLLTNTEIATNDYMNAKKADGSFQKALEAVKPESGEQGVFFIEKRKGYDLREVIQAKVVRPDDTSTATFDTGRVRSYQFFGDMLNMGEMNVNTTAVADKFFGLTSINYQLGGGDLGILTRQGQQSFEAFQDGGVLGGSPNRTFTLGGRNSSFLGAQKAGVTIQEGDTLRFSNFSMIDDFQNGIFAVNDGTFEFIKGNTLFSASIVDSASKSSPAATVATKGTLLVNGANVVLGDYGHKIDIEEISIIGVNVHGAKPTPADPTKTVYVDQYIGLFDFSEYIEVMETSQKNYYIGLISNTIKAQYGGNPPTGKTEAEFQEMLTLCFTPNSLLNATQITTKNTYKEQLRLNDILQKDLGTIRMKIDQEISTTEAYPVFINQNKLEIAEGSLTANAGQLKISDKIYNGDTLVLTGGELKAKVTNYTNTEVTPNQPVIGTVCIGDGSAAQQIVNFDNTTTIENNILYVNTNGNLRTEPASLPHIGDYSVATMNEGVLRLQGGNESTYKTLAADQIITGGGKIEIGGFIQSKAQLTNNVDVLAGWALKIQPELLLSQLTSLQNNSELILYKEATLPETTSPEGIFNSRVTGNGGTVKLESKIGWGPQADIYSNGTVNLWIPKEGHLNLVNGTAENFVVSGHFKAGTPEINGTYKWENAGHASIDVINNSSMDLLTVKGGAEGKLIIDEVKMAGELMPDVNDMNIASVGNKLFFPLDIQGDNTLQIAGINSSTDSNKVNRVVAVLDNYYYTFDQVIVHKDADLSDEVDATLNYFNFANPGEDGEFIDPATLAETYYFDIALAKAQSTGQPVQGIMVTKGTGFNLRQILHNYKLDLPDGNFLMGADISTYSFSKDTINIDKVEIDTTAGTAQINLNTGSIELGGGDLGILTRKSKTPYAEGGQLGSSDSAAAEGETRYFMFNGNGHAFYGGQFDGITVQEEDTLVFNNISLLDDFKNSVLAKNDGILEFSGGRTQLNASITDSGGSNTKGTVFISDAEVGLAEKSANYNFKGTLVKPNTTNSFAVNKDGKVYYVLPEVASTTEGAAVVIKQANLEIAESGSLTAKADQLQVSSEIRNEGLLVMNGGTLGSKLTGSGCTLINESMSMGTGSKIYIGFNEMTDEEDGDSYVPPEIPKNHIYVGGKSILMINAAIAKKTDENPDAAGIKGVHAGDGGEPSIKFDGGKLYLSNLTSKGTYIIFSGDGVKTDEVYVAPEEVLIDDKFYKLFLATDLGDNKFGYEAQINTIEGVYGDNVTVTPSVWNEIMQKSEGTKAHEFIKKLVSVSTTSSSSVMAVDALNTVSEMTGVAAVDQSVISITNYAFAEMVANNNLMVRPANTFSQPHAMHTSAASDRELKIDTVEQGKGGEVMPKPYELPKYAKNIWASLMHNKEHVDGLALANHKANYTAQYNGLIVGVDLWASHKAYGGIALSKTDGNIRGTTGGVDTKNDADYYGISFYNRVTNGNSAILTDIGYTRSKNDITQRIPLTGDEITADAKIDTITAGVRYEKSFSIGRSNLIPFVGLRYVFNRNNEFTNSQGITYDPDNQHLFMPSVGIGWSGEFEMPGSAWTFRPHVEGGYVWNLGDRQTEETVSFGGASNTIGYDVGDKGSYYLNFAMDFRRDNVTFGVNYRYQKGHAVWNNKWNFNVNFAF